MKQFKVGLQLYSIRDKMEQDMDGALAAVKRAGYDYVEFAGYFGKTAEEVRALLDKHGLTCLSVHQGYQVFLDAPEENVAYIKTLGAKYCAIPWMGIENHKGHPGYEKAMEDIKKVAKLLADNDIKLLYHNHEFEFERFEGKAVLDWMYEEIPALSPQIDTCWAHYAGEDPCDYLAKYAGRIHVVHLKDYVCANRGNGPVYALIADDGTETKPVSREDNGFRFRPVGAGVQNFPAILEAAEKAGAEVVIVEQDSCYDEDTIDSAAMSRAYLKSLGQ